MTLPGELAGRYGLTETVLEIEAGDMRALYRILEARHPGLGEALSSKMFAILDGDIVQDAYLEPLDEVAEVAFMPLIRGG